MSDEKPKDLVLVKLDRVLARLDEVESRMHNDMQQIKIRLSALEKQVANMGEAVAAQWENFDRHEERLYRLEHPTT